MDSRALRRCRARFAIDLHPCHAADALGGIREQLDAWLLRQDLPAQLRPRQMVAALIIPLLQMLVRSVSCAGHCCSLPPIVAACCVLRMLGGATIWAV